jgi:hypothetical protein
MGVSDYGAYAGKSGEFVGSSLGVTTGYHNAAFGVLAVNAANCRSHILIGRSGNCAGVQNNNLRLLGAGRGEALSQQVAFNSGAIGL